MSITAARYYIYPYRKGSKSARALAEALGGKVLRREGSEFVQREHKKVINWGASDCPWFGSLNHSHSVGVVANKLQAFSWWSSPNAIDNPRIPDVTTERSIAQSWLQDCSVVARTILTGHSGAGIIIAEKGSDPNGLVEAPLYVKYVPKDMEFRVHLFQNSVDSSYDVIDVQRKIRDPNSEPTNWKVRSHANGFIFVRQGFDVPPDVITQARRAITVSGLHFGGVDVIWNQQRGLAYVLECNTAVGLQGETVQRYADAIKRYYDPGVQS